MVPADVPVLLDLLKEQNERDSTDYPMTQVFDDSGRRMPNVELALVAVDEETGEVMQGHIWERTLEHMAIGISREATVCSMHEQGAFTFILRERGYHDFHIFIPKIRVKQMRHGLEKILGMIDTGLTHFYRRLDPAENDELRKVYEDREAKV
jgi:hypothetical protein